MSANHQSSARGFTIVELLIVIVVIAVLAAISVVAYNGIQYRARTSSIQGAVHQTQKLIELTNIEEDSYPSSINDCPNPAIDSACLQVPSGYTVTYTRISQGARPSPLSAGVTARQSYELTLCTNDTVLYKSPAERTGTNEFLQYMDMAPIIDQFGLRPYQISFDIKSANISTVSAANVYMQNGSGAKYSFGASVPVATSYVRKTITVTPTVWQGGMTGSALAFYGNYGTGNILSVKNVEIMLAS